PILDKKRIGTNSNLLSPASNAAYPINIRITMPNNVRAYTIFNLILFSRSLKNSENISISKCCFSLTAIAEPKSTNQIKAKFLNTSNSGTENENTYLVMTPMNKTIDNNTIINTLRIVVAFERPLKTLLMDNLVTSIKLFTKTFLQLSLWFDIEISYLNTTPSTGIQRSEEHRLNSSHVSISYAVFCLKI